MSQHEAILNLHLRNQVSDFYSNLTNPLLEEQIIVFDESYNKMIECETYLNTYLIEKAEMYMYSLDF